MGLAILRKLVIVNGLFVLFSMGLSLNPVSASDFTISAFKYQQKMADLGYAEAQYKLAEMYEDGVGTKQDLGKALHWYRKSAAQGYEPAKQKIEGVIAKKKQPSQKASREAQLQAEKKREQERQAERRRLEAEKEAQQRAEMEKEQKQIAAERKRLEQERRQLQAERARLEKARLEQERLAKEKAERALARKRAHEAIARQLATPVAME